MRWLAERVLTFKHFRNWPDAGLLGYRWVGAVGRTNPFQGMMAHSDKTFF